MPMGREGVPVPHRSERNGVERESGLAGIREQAGAGGWVVGARGRGRVGDRVMGRAIWGAGL